MAKWPREYARQIAAMTEREKRKEALAQVPEEYRQLVMNHVVNAFAMKKLKRERS